MAINEAGRKWEEENEKLKKLETVDEKTAKEMRKHSLNRERMKALLTLYEIETGNEYNYDYELGE